MYSEDQYTNHQVFNTLNDCINKFKSEKEGNHNEFFERVHQLCNIIQERLESVDFYTAPTYLVNSLQNNLNKAQNEYNNYKSRNNTSHLDKIERAVEATLVNSKNLFVGTEDIEKDYAEALKSFRSSASQHLRYFKDELNELKQNFTKTKETINSDLKALQNQISEQNKRIDGVVDNFQNQLSELQQKQVQNFQENESTRQSDFQEKIEKFTTDFNQQLETLKEKSKQELESISSQTSKIVNVLKEKEQEALTRVGVIANTGMAGGYQKVANQALWTKRIWQIATVLSLGVLIWFSVDMYQTATSNGTELTLGSASIRIFVTVAIALFAGYSAKQADTNSKIERVNRQMELELSSIDMYLAKFDDEKQLQIKEDLADKWFGNIQSGKLTKDSKSQTTLLGHVAETARNLSEKINT